MPLVKSIGVYTLEQDKSQYISADSPILPGAVVYGSWGAYDTVQTVTSVSELISTVGEAVSSSYKGLIGLKKYFKYGNQLQVVRAENSSDAYGVKTFNATADPSLVIQALYKGAFGNEISIKISTENSLKRIDVYVQGALAETYLGLEKASGADKNANYKTAINGVSVWVTVKTDATADAETSEPDDIVATNLTSGASTLPTKADFIGTATGGPSSGPSGLQCFATDSVVVDILLCPDSASLSSETDAKDVSKEIESIAESRKDLVGLVDFPAGKSRDNAITYADDTAAWNSTYVSAYWPWVQYTEAAISTDVYVPGSLSALIVVAKNDSIAFPWYAAFGYQRGIITEALEVEYNSSLGDRDLLMGSQINVFTKETGVGVVTLGNYTKYSTLQATQSLNVRRLLLFIKKGLSAAAKTLLAEPNDPVSWAQFVSMANRFLSQIEAKRGLQPGGFLVICDTTTNTSDIIDQKKMVAVIKLQPTRAIEVIELTLQVTASGATFDE